MKKILLTLFTFVLALNAVAQNGIVYNPDFKTSGKSCGVSWSVNTDTWELIINGNGKMTNQAKTENVEWLAIERTVQIYANNEIIYTAYERLADKITKITINEGITHIGNNAFSGMIKLTTVTLPESVESIGESAFQGCNVLKDLTGKCNFETLKIHQTSFSGSGLLEDNGALYIAQKLIKVYELSETTTINVKDDTKEICAEAFKDNGNITKIVIPEKVTKIGDNAFNGCTKLKDFTLEGNNVTFGSNVFAGCSSLPIDKTETYRKAGDNIIVEVYDIDEEIYQIPSNIIYIADKAFAKCTNVKTIKCAFSTPAMATTALWNNNGPHLYVEDGNEDKFKGKGIADDKINYTDINLHSSGYSTIALDHSAIIPDGVEAYTVTSDGTTIHYKRVTGNKLAKGTGYFIVGTGKATFKPAKESIAEGNNNNLVGVTEKTKVSGSGIYFLSTTQNGVTGFFCLGDDNSYEFPANKAYLQVSGTIGNAQYFLVNLDETETRIDNTESEEKTSHSRNNVYNLAGQKMSHPQKGINIVNGKLTIM
jgi:hypothetical protein